MNAKKRVRVPKYYTRPKMRYEVYRSWYDISADEYVIAARTATGPTRVLERVSRASCIYQPGKIARILEGFRNEHQRG
jgi:hypothetical protein